VKRPSVLAVLVLVLSALRPGEASANSVNKITFEGGASTTGWIDFDYQDGKRIFVPAKINGHDVEVLLATGLPVSDIDKSFASSIGLQPQAGPQASGATAEKAGSIRGLRIQIGRLTLQDTAADPVDFGPFSKHIGHTLTFLLGDDVFNDLAVDIDFAHHRIAFSEPDHQVKPDGSVEIPLSRVEDLPLVPVSIEGAPPAQFEMGIGNSGEILVYQSYYESHKLLQGRRISTRLAAGTGGFNPETVGILNNAEFAGFKFSDMPAAFVPASLAGTKSGVIAGDLGLPVLSRFRLIIDYSHGRIYAVPYATAMQQPFAKDRLGLWLSKDDSGLAVEFVAPGSPAQAAGFKIGDKIALIDGKPVRAWPESAVADLRYAAAGTSTVFTMQGGGVRRVELADYF
jgi:hypothetical protein